MSEQDTFDFVTEAKKTASNEFHQENVSASLLYAAMRAAIGALDDVDVMRKALFYGRAIPDVQLQAIRSRVSGGFMPDNRRTYPPIPHNLTHGILGSACEGGEKLDLLVRAMDGESFDRIGYFEECGDAMWYDTIGLDIVGFTPEDVMRGCIAKLRKRSGDLFDAGKFNERDLQSERTELEKAATPEAKGDKVRVRKDDE